MNTKFDTHPFAQLTAMDAEHVNGGSLRDTFKPITMRIPEDGINPGPIVTKPLEEDGNGPIYTTLALGEEGGDLPPLL